jgi:peptide deformylase
MNKIMSKTTSKIVTVPHPTLRQVSTPVTALDKRFSRLLHDLEHSLTRHQNPPGVGLALPQIGHNLQVFATLLPDKSGRLCYRAFINPELTAASDQTTTRHPGDKEDVLEGCLSVPSLYAAVARPQAVEFHFYTLTPAGKLQERTETFTDFPARVMQHEYDHLRGVLFTDYLLDNNTKIFISKAGHLEELPDKNLLRGF